MKIGYIYSFIAISVTFFLFYFNAPYWFGKEMYETSKNGIWRFIYIGLSTIGHSLYRICERLSRFILSIIFSGLKLKKDKHPTLNLLVNLFTYIGAISLLSLGYEKITDSFVLSSNADINTLGGESKGFFAKISFVRIVLSLYTQGLGTADIVTNKFAFGFATAAFVLFMWAVLLLVNTVYFSILYGFLKEKLTEIDLLKNIPNRNEVANEISHNTSVSRLILDIKNEIIDFVKKQTIITNLENKMALFVFMPLLFAFSSFLYFIGNYTPSFWGTLLEILDSTNLVSILVSFIITWFCTKGVQKSGAFVISKSPAGVQSFFESKSEDAGKKAEEYLEERIKWAKANDLVHETNRSNHKEESKQQSKNANKHETDVNNSNEKKQRREDSAKGETSSVSELKFHTEYEAEAFLREKYGKEDISEVVAEIMGLIPPTFIKNKEYHNGTESDTVAAANFCMEVLGCLS